MGAATELAFSADDSRLAPLPEVADEIHSTLIVGPAVKTVRRPQIAALVLTPEGNVHVGKAAPGGLHVIG